MERNWLATARKRARIISSRQTLQKLFVMHCIPLFSATCALYHYHTCTAILHMYVVYDVGSAVCVRAHFQTATAVTGRTFTLKDAGPRGIIACYVYEYASSAPIT